MVNLGSAYGEIIIGTADGEKAIKSLSSTLRGIGTKLSMAISAPLAGVAAAGLKAAAGFEQSMNMLQVATNATEQSMQALQSKALELGAETSFSAGEAADAMLELAKAGMSADQTMQAIGGVMDLAAAGGVALADAATITAAALNAFHLPASEAANVANLLAAAANASAADITDLSQGLQQGGFAFGAAGQQVDDLVASLAILTNVGLTGSDAGTALKNAMMRLMNPTKKAAELMDELGINAYDAQGNMLPFADVIEEINQGTKDMTQEQRNAALSTIFLSDGMKAFIPLLDAGKDGFLAMKEEVNAEGAAAEMANARMKGLAGAIEYIKGSIESVLIEVALPFLDFLSNTIRRVADTIASFTKLPTPIRNAVLAFLAVIAAIGPVALALGKLGGILAALFSPITLIGLALAVLAAAWVGNFGGIQEKTAAAWAVIRSVFEAMMAWLQVNVPAALGVLSSALNSLASYFGAVVEDGDVMNDWLTHLPEVVRPVVMWMGRITTVLISLQSLWLSYWPLIQSVTTAALNAISQRLAATMGWLNSNIPAALSYLRTAWSTQWAQIQGFTASAWAAISTTFFAVRSWLQVNIPAALSYLRGVWETTWGVVQGYVARAWAVVEPVLSTMWRWLAVNVPAAIATLRTWWSNFWTNLPAMANSAWTTIVATLQQMYRWFTVDLPASIVMLRAWWSSTWADMQGRVAAAWAVIQPPLNMIWSWLNTYIPAALSYLQGVWNTYWPQLQGAVAAAWAAIQPALSAMWAWLQMALPLAVTWLQATWSNFWTNLPTTVTNAWATVQETFATIKKWFDTDIPASLTTMQTSWNATWTRIGEVVGVVKDALTTLWTNLTTLFGPAIENLSTSFNKMIDDFSKSGPRFGELGTAITNVATQIGKVLMILGAAIAIVVYVIAITAINLLAATFANLGAIVDGVVEGITVALNGISSVIQGVIDIVGGLIIGDWALVWQGAQEVMNGFLLFLVGFGIAAKALIVGAFNIIKDTIIGTLQSLGVDTDAALAVVKNAWAVTWAQIYLNYNSINSALLSAWTGLVTWFTTTLPNALSTLRDDMSTKWQEIKSAVMDRISPILGSFSSMKEWLETTLQSALTTFKTFISNLSLPNPFEFLENSLNSIYSMIDSVKAKIEAFRAWISSISIPNPFAGVSAPSVPSGTASGSGVVGASGVNIIVNVSGVNGEMDWNRAAKRIAREVVVASR